MVYLFTDRIEIQSPGKLSGNITLDNLTTQRFSRNKRIAMAMMHLGMVRKLGEGVDRILEEMNKRGLPKPTFRNEGNNFTVILRNDFIQTAALNFLDEYKEQYKESKKAERKKMLNKLDVQVYLYYGIDANEWNQLSPDEQMILIYMLNEKQVYRRSVEQLLGKSKSVTSKVLSDLVEKGLIKKVSQSNVDKETYYEKK